MCDLIKSHRICAPPGSNFMHCQWATIEVSFTLYFLSIICWEGMWGVGGGGIAICRQNKIETAYLVRCGNKIDDSPIFLKVPQCSPARWGPTWATWWSGWCFWTRWWEPSRPTWWSRSEKEVSPSNWWHRLSHKDKITLKQFDCEIWDSQLVLCMEYFEKYKPKYSIAYYQNKIILWWSLVQNILQMIIRI